MKRGMEQLVSRMKCPKCRGNFTLEIKESDGGDVIEGSFYNCFLNIKEDSEGFAKLKDICEKNDLNGDERCFLEDDCLKMHRDHFGKVSINRVVESIYDCTENALDLLPYPGEWFAYNIFVCL